MARKKPKQHANELAFRAVVLAGKPKQEKRQRNDGLRPRDTVHDDYLAHHDVTARANVVGGDRTYTRLEQMLDGGYIRPEDSEAGLRYWRDWAVGQKGSGESCLSPKVRGSGTGGPDQTRLDATRRYVIARAAVDAGYQIRGSNFAASFIMEKLVLYDNSYSEIAHPLQCKKERAKEIVRRCLELLTAHYDEIDRTSGRSSTVHTKVAAKKKFEPSDDRNPFERGG